jgi:hypothetical protein
MPLWLTRLLSSTAWRRVRWEVVWRAAKWLYTRGRDLLEKNLTKKERQELLDLMRKSRGLARNLTPKERQRVRDLVRNALLGDAKKRKKDK